MDSFESTFAQVCVLNDTEGPSRNVLEPKFQARDQFEKMEQAINGVIQLPDASADTVKNAHLQLARIGCVLVQNFIDTDEITNAEKKAVQSYEHVITGLSGSPATFPSIDAVVAHDKGPIMQSNDFANFADYLRILNVVGIYLTGRQSSQRFDDALKVLHEAEQLFVAWCSRQSLPDLSLGKQAVWSDNAVAKEILELHNSTVFFLAQCYGNTGSVEESSRYCHRTMTLQLVSEKDYSPKEWARNAVHLSGFFNTVGLFDESLHCMLAARRVMPTDKPDEDTVGVVAWGFGKLHKARLRWFAEEREPERNLGDRLRIARWWKPFPLGIDASAPLPPITDFESARSAFKLAHTEMLEAAKYYVFDGCCTDHIEIQRDIATLYLYLIHFEPSLDRRIAMHGRRLDLIKTFPDLLNFNAYGTLVRQLLFDAGDIASEVLDLRLEQKKGKLPGALTDAQFNDANDQAKRFFERFLATFSEKKDQPLDRVDEESRVPVFRALMRLSSLQSKRFYKTPKAEYDGIATVIEKYEACVAFARRNGLEQNPEIGTEIRLAHEMLTLLPGKQKQIWKAFNATA